MHNLPAQLFHPSPPAAAAAPSPLPRPLLPITSDAHPSCPLSLSRQVSKELAFLSCSIEQLPEDTKWSTIESLLHGLTPQQRQQLLELLPEA
jgi:hypothetical protein